MAPESKVRLAAKACPTPNPNAQGESQRARAGSCGRAAEPVLVVVVIDVRHVLGENLGEGGRGNFTMACSGGPSAIACPMHQRMGMPMARHKQRWAKAAEATQCWQMLRQHTHLAFAWILQHRAKGSALRRSPLASSAPPASTTQRRGIHG